MKEFCVDLQLAKELKKNIFPQETLFYWGGIWDCTAIESEDTPIDYECIMSRNEAQIAESDGSYSAPTSDEILKELPKIIIPNHTRYDMNIRHYINQHLKKKYEISFLSICLKMNEEHPDNYISFDDKFLPNALAKMWLYLKKEGYINDNSFKKRT